MTLDQAERLAVNDDFKAFMQVLGEDAASMTEDLVYHKDAGEIIRTQCKVLVLRGVKERLNHLIDDLKNPTPASAQQTESAV